MNLAWARSTRMLVGVVQQYRFERRREFLSDITRMATAKLVRNKHPSIVDPVNYAGVCIEWPEREHRERFWRCCPDHQVL